MGANATTFVPTYVASEVLTAADLNVTNSGIPVFATTVTRDAAFGGTGEKTLAEGQFAYIEASNTTQYYDGAAWQTVGGGLVVVQTETAFTASNSIVANNVFTSAYRNYTIKFTSIASTGVGLLIKMRVGGVSASTNYNYQSLSINGTSITGSRSSSQTSADVGSIAPQESAITINLYNPAVAVATNFDSFTAYVSGAFTSPVSYFYTGNHSTATAYDGIEILPSSGTLTGSYTIYGWGK
jgi:hypothetical protein